MKDWKAKAERALGETVKAVDPVFGASTFKIQSSSRKFYFCKQSGVATSRLHEEADGLKALGSAVRVPKVLFVDSGLLILEWIEPVAPSAVFWGRLAEALVTLHSQTHGQFGFTSDNFIGATPQLNPLRAISEVSWSEYFIEYRLKPMLHHSVLSTDSLLQASFHKSESKVRAALDSVREKPCLVHGDLWSGNFLCAGDQIPVLIDPAVYYGHREVDLALSELFGGFDLLFYETYKKALPLTPGYESRRSIYNLYHLLNHWILFGDSYRRQALQVLNSF